MSKNVLKIAKNALTSNYLIGASSIYVLSSFLLKGVNFITTPIFTRIMSPEEYGNVSSAVMLTSFLAIFICCQVSSSIYTAKVDYDKDGFNEFAYHLSVFSIISAVVIGFIVYLLGEYITTFVALDGVLIVPIIFAAVGTSFITLYSSFLVAQKKPKNKAIFSIVVSVSTVLVSLITVLSVQSHKDYARIISISFVHFIATVVIFLLLRSGRSPSFQTEQFKKNVKYALVISFPLILHLLANLINSQADRLFIIRMMSNKDLALYSVSYSLGMVFLAFIDAFMMAWTPWYYEKTKKNEPEKVHKACKVMFLLLALLFSLIMLLSPELLAIVAPASYSSAQTCVVAIAFGVFFQSLYKFPSCYEVYKKNTKYVAMCTIISGVLNIGLNFILIPTFGIFGAALATAISYIVLFVLHDIAARYLIGDYNIKRKVFIYPIVIVLLSAVVGYIYGGSLFVRLITLVTLCIICGLYAYSYMGILKQFKRHENLSISK